MATDRWYYLKDAQCHTRPQSELSWQFLQKIITIRKKNFLIRAMITHFRWHKQLIAIQRTFIDKCLQKQKLSEFDKIWSIHKIIPFILKIFWPINLGNKIKPPDHIWILVYRFQTTQANELAQNSPKPFSRNFNKKSIHTSSSENPRKFLILSYPHTKSTFTSFWIKTSTLQSNALKILARSTLKFWSQW